MDFLSSGLSITRGYMTRIFITLLTVMLMSDHPQIAQFKKQGSLWDARMHEFDIIISYPYELGFIINYEDMYYTWANFSLISKVLYVASIWKLAWTTKLHWKWMIHIGDIGPWLTKLCECMLFNHVSIIWAQMDQHLMTRWGSYFNPYFLFNGHLCMYEVHKQYSYSFPTYYTLFDTM